MRKGDVAISVVRQGDEIATSFSGRTRNDNKRLVYSYWLFLIFSRDALASGGAMARNLVSFSQVYSSQ